jgi:DNA-binding NarL/FixJ family response regulator
MPQGSLLAVSAPPDALSKPVAKRPKRILLVDDSPGYADRWRAALAERYGDAVVFEAYSDPIQAIPHIGPDVDVLLLDLELPMMDGRKLAELARMRGVACRRIVILSGHDADELHRLFPPNSCLAVINKTDPNQQSAFQMILDSLVLKH